MRQANGSALHAGQRLPRSQCNRPVRPVGDGTRRRLRQPNPPIASARGSVISRSGRPPRAAGDSWRSVRAVALAAALALAGATACASSEPTARPGGTTTRATPGQGPSAPQTSCPDGTSRVCTRTLPSAVGVLSCYEGSQDSQDGTWGECGRGRVVERRLAASLMRFGSLWALSLPVECTDNPCNPDGRVYVEDPGAAIQTDFEPTLAHPPAIRRPFPTRSTASGRSTASTTSIATSR